MGNKIGEFFSNNGGFIFGVIVGLIAIYCRIIDFIVTIFVVIAFGYLGSYIQRNKSTVKEKLKNLIEKW